MAPSALHPCYGQPHPCAFFGFLRAGEIVVSSDTGFDASQHSGSPAGRQIRHWRLRDSFGAYKPRYVAIIGDLAVFRIFHVCDSAQ